MCALLMPLMCFPRHPLSNYFAKGQEVLSSISKQPHLPSTIWNLVITSKSHKEKNIQSKASETFENNNIFCIIGIFRCASISCTDGRN